MLLLTDQVFTSAASLWCHSPEVVLRARFTSRLGGSRQSEREIKNNICSAPTFDRYWAGSESGAPVFVCVGGESYPGTPLDATILSENDYCNDMVELAPAHNVRRIVSLVN